MTGADEGNVEVGEDGLEGRVRLAEAFTRKIQGGKNHPVAGKASPANLKCHRPKISRKRSKSATENFFDF